MKTMNTVVPWMTRQINRRAFLNRSTSATFGVLAAVAVGVPRQASVAAASCSPCPGSNVHCCNYYSSLFCNGSSCNTSSYYHKCQYYYQGCESGGFCWSHNGHKCCDCKCSYCSRCNTVYCICYG